MSDCNSFGVGGGFVYITVLFILLIIVGVNF
ncbi:YjcZ family sporulation protein [Peribacillus asahii]|uniref:YjcZ family sporulation protein n=1 Tax=Peribacillus asahii TaxID=228899 RepID=A0A398AZH9_9BACI|nr:YjcZ family sporulation protein [Peribacillus asahii]RID82952.1 YjcZ family sporulation protein [Peribacillus asahii]